jgi:hypothetical protein
VTNINYVAIARTFDLEKQIPLVLRFAILHPLRQCGGIVGRWSYKAIEVSKGLFECTEGSHSLTWADLDRSWREYTGGDGMIAPY